MRKAFIIISTLIGFIAFGQKARLDQIDEKVKSIESDSTLSLAKFEFKILPGITTGSKEVRRIWQKKKRIYKIVQEIEYLNYITQTSIYLENGIPIKIIEIEKNFEQTKDGLDYSNPIKVFDAIIYVFDWENDESKIIKNGKRTYTEGNCSSFDYEPLIENAKNSITE